MNKILIAILTALPVSGIAAAADKDLGLSPLIVAASADAPSSEVRIAMPGQTLITAGVGFERVAEVGTPATVNVA